MTAWLASTYRLQLNPSFRFADARAVMGYIDALGISSVYTSPYLRAAKGSTHGYNLVAPREVNPELGGESEHRALIDAIREKRMGHILDMVPNHMGIGSGENIWWQDVLENGPSSCYADYFDIEWAPIKPALHGRVLLPILGANYGQVLEEGELKLVREGGAFFIAYYEHRFPVSPPSLIGLMESALATLPLADDPATQEFASIATALRHLPQSHETEPERRAERAREKEIFKRRLDQLCESAPHVKEALDKAIAQLNGTPGGDPRSFDALDSLLRDQNFRLSYWRVATEEINYRRFFDINELAAIRMETDAVFDEVHALVFDLIKQGKIDGLRLDHTDGLYEPSTYFEKLQQCVEPPSSLSKERPLYLLAEKILEPGESLRTRWLIHGTTGYDYIAASDSLFVDSKAERAFTRIYQDITGDARPFDEHVHAAKHAILRSSLASEVNMLAQALERIADGDRHSRDYTYRTLVSVLREAISAFPVYRTYIRADRSYESNDVKHIERAIKVAKRRNPEMDASTLDFVRDVLLLRLPTEDQAIQSACVRFTKRFQQLTGPVMAKGVEDTAFYTYVRFVALNEVGNRPDRFGNAIEAYHAQNADRLRQWPLSMTTLSTHDTKRGEDVRARLGVLTEMPEEWATQVQNWREIGARYRTQIEEEVAPSGTDEYLFYQTVVGAFPFAESELAGFANRVRAYAIKAAREAKLRTSWLRVNDGYEAALAQFVDGMLGDQEFLSSLRAFVERIAIPGACNGLAATLLRIAAPGVPDTYQGSETWHLRLVDPDNREPVDYATLAKRLDRLVHECESPESCTTPLLANFKDGAIKTYVLMMALRVRRKWPDLFLAGDYTPLAASAGAAPHVIAFARSDHHRTVIAAAPRFPHQITSGVTSGMTSGVGSWPIGEVWRDESLTVESRGLYRNLLTGEKHKIGGKVLLADLFKKFPVALLIKE